MVWLLGGDRYSGLVLTKDNCLQVTDVNGGEIQIRVRSQCDADPMCRID